MENQKHKYQVNLLKIFSRTYNENGSFQDKDDQSNAKFYNIPSKMSWPEGSTHHDCEKDKSNKNYGLLERVRVQQKEVGRVGQDVPRYPFKDFTKWENNLRQMINDTYQGSEVPEFICNLSCLVALMSPSQDTETTTTFRAIKIDLPEGKRTFYLKHGFQTKYESSKKSYGHYLEAELAYNNSKVMEDSKQLVRSNGRRRSGWNIRQEMLTDAHQELPYKIPESYSRRKDLQNHPLVNPPNSCSRLQTQNMSTQNTANIKIDGNQVFQAFYRAKLTSPQNEIIKIAFTAETDGLWIPSKPFASYEETDITEMKSVDLTNLTPAEGSSVYFFEENLLRKFYCQSRIRGIEYFLCNFVEDKSLKEEWLYDVDQIPKVIEKCSIKSSKKWNRAFPKGLLSAEDLEVCLCRRRGQLKKWTEEDCFRSLFSSLQTIKSSFNDSNWDGYRYFIRDGLTVQNNKFNIEEIDKQSYDETEIVKKILLVKCDSENGRMTRTMMEKAVNNFLTFAEISLKPGSGNQIKEILKDHVIYKRKEYSQDDLFVQITFKNQECAKAAYQRFWDNKRNKRNGNPPYNVKIYKQQTTRQCMIS